MYAQGQSVAAVVVDDAGHNMSSGGKVVAVWVSYVHRRGSVHWDSKHKRPRELGWEINKTTKIIKIDPHNCRRRL